MVEWATLPKLSLVYLLTNQVLINYLKSSLTFSETCTVWYLNKIYENSVKAFTYQQTTPEDVQIQNILPQIQKPWNFWKLKNLLKVSPNIVCLKHTLISTKTLDSNTLFVFVVVFFKQNLEGKNNNIVMRIKKNIK